MKNIFFVTKNKVFICYIFVEITAYFSLFIKSCCKNCFCIKQDPYSLAPIRRGCSKEEGGLTLKSIN